MRLLVADRGPAAASSSHGERAIDHVLTTWTARYDLSQSEADILSLAARGLDRGAIADTRAVTSATIKTQIHSMLQSTGDRSLEHAVSRVLREALGIE